MPRSSGVNHFDTLRSWNGSQSRAFEELSYQLLKSDVPSGSQAIRTGNPDGGVEWYATLPDTTEWGWQAKHVHGIDALLAGMTDSVQRVVRDRPELVKLTFVISWNLATSTRGGERISQRQKFEYKIASWKKHIRGAKRIEFELIQGSDLLAILARPEHRGRAWFWWETPVFDSGWLERRFKEQAAAAGEKYRPDLQVDLPIEEDLKALGATQSIFEEFKLLRQKVISAGHDMHLVPIGPQDLVKLHNTVSQSAKQLIDACQKVILQASINASSLDPLKSALSEFLSSVSNAEQREFELEIKWSKQPPENHDEERQRPLAEMHGYSVRKLRDAASELESLLNSSVGRALQQRNYLLVGPAGSGKTHLFLGSVHQAIEEGRPAVVLFGARFGSDNLWGSICDQLGLKPIGADVLLGAMDAAGEASSVSGRRFVLLIDALNETVPPNFWVRHLPTLRASIALWPHVSLAVSCRDTYLDVVDDDNERSQYVLRKHPGFAGREVEATQKYFTHYNLEAPCIPLLVPEFSLPLFLKMYCESLRDSRQSNSAIGHEGRVRIFDRYLSVKLKRVAHLLRPTAASTYEIEHAKSCVSKVIDALLDEFALTGREGICVERAEELATTVMNGTSYDTANILGALQNEGLLIREMLYLGGNSMQDGFCIVFQAFADYLILRKRLSAIEDPMNDADLRRWLLDDCSLGIVEAAAVALPELYDTELPDFLGISAKSMEFPDSDDDGSRLRSIRAQRVFQAVFETLPYRDARAITERTIKLFNQSFLLITPDKLFRKLFLMAPQPDNRLNAEALHRYLMGFKMPKRDSFFGFATYHEIFDESSPIATLARWAALGPYPKYDPQVIELSCVPLIWLLSSSNRFMRDWVTKALVQLLRGHLDVARRLVERFWEIDDPYVIQRVVVIAYGALMRSNPSDHKDAKKLAKVIWKLVFTHPIRADELMLDAARGGVEWGVAHNLLPKKALIDIRRPYKLAPPRGVPTEATLKKKYGFNEGQPPNESYSTIRLSLWELGDFGRDVVASGIQNFSRYRCEEEFPEKEHWPEPRFIKSRWVAFKKALTPKQREDLGKFLKETAESKPAKSSEFCRTLNEKQAELLRSVWKQPSRRRLRNDEYPVDKALRWVFKRTLTLGWRPQLFGFVDHRIAQSRGGREAHKSERWGKKYQWMAYHELLARIADNFQPVRQWDASKPYEGLYQIIAEREIDPSLPPIDYRGFVEGGGEGKPTWRPAPIRVVDWPPSQPDFKQYGGSIERFLSDTASEPTLDHMSFVTDAENERWFLLSAYFSQGDPSADKRWLGLQQVIALDSWLTPRDQTRLLLPHLLKLEQSHRWDLIDDQGHVDCCYAGEIGWTPHKCYHQQAKFRELVDGEQRWQLVPTVETVMWEGNSTDCSIGDFVFAAMPSTFIQAKAKLILDERGPSWWDTTEDVVFMNYGVDEPIRCRKSLLVRGTWLQKFLTEHNLELLVRIYCERRLVDSDHRQHHPSQIVYSAARINADLNIFISNDQVRKQL